MAAHLTLLIATFMNFMVVGSGLKTVTRTNSSRKTDWDVLYEAFQSDKTLSFGWTCSSPEYHEYVKTLPEVDFRRLKIPPDTSIFFYGTSLLHELLQNILVANGDTLIRSGPFGGFEGDLYDTTTGSMTNRQEVWEGMSGYLVEWKFSHNSRILEAQNYHPLQSLGNPATVENLKNFMDEHQFDLAFFMNPHLNEEGQAKHDACVKECKKRMDAWLAGESKDLPNCKSECPNPAGANGERKDANPLWNAIYEKMRGNLYEVEAWHDVQTTFFHADREHRILTFPFLNHNWCNVDDDCTQNSKARDHQCQPGNLNQISEKLVETMTAAIPALRPSSSNNTALVPQ